MQVSVDECTQGIVRVAQQTHSLDPRQQGTFEWEMSAGINTQLNHNCTGKTKTIIIIKKIIVYSNAWIFSPYILVVLLDQDGGILDAKPIHFKTLDNCIYCSDGQCNCTVSTYIHEHAY